MRVSAILRPTAEVSPKRLEDVSKLVIGVAVEANDGHAGKIMVAATVCAGLFAGIGVGSAIRGGGSSALMISALLALTFFAFAFRLFSLRRKVRGVAASWPHWTEPALEPERAVVFIIALLAILFVVVSGITGEEDPPVPASLQTLVAGIFIATPLVQIFVTKASAWRDLLSELVA